MGAMQQVSKGAHGYAGYFTGSILNDSYKETLSLEEGLKIMKMCANEMRHRFLIDQSKFIVKIITKDGIKIENI